MELESFRHIGTIIGIVLLRPLLTSSWPAGAFVVPEAMLGITLIAGLFLQPETKGKALIDQMVETRYGRLENELPRALIRWIRLLEETEKMFRLAAGHKVAQMEIRKQLRLDMQAAEAAAQAGYNVKHNPWKFKVYLALNLTGMQGEGSEYSRSHHSGSHLSEHSRLHHSSHSHPHSHLRQDEEMEDIEL